MIEIFLPVGVSLVVLAFGVWVFLKPLQVIEFQKRFYALINWRMEPINMAKEIRNTKAMGFFVIVVWFFSSILFLCLAFLN